MSRKTILVVAALCLLPVMTTGQVRDVQREVTEIAQLPTSAPAAVSGLIFWHRECSSYLRPT